MKPLILAKAITMPFACFGLFIWAVVRSGGPGGLALSTSMSNKTLLAWSFVGAVNAAINGEFGPLIASDSKNQSTFSLHISNVNQLISPVTPARLKHNLLVSLQLPHGALVLSFVLVSSRQLARRRYMVPHFGTQER